MKFWYINLTLLFFAYDTNISFAQSLNEFIAANKSMNEIIIKEKEIYEIKIDNDELKVSRETYEESMIMNEIGIQNDYESFYYSSLLPVEEYEAYTILPDSKKNRKIDVTQESESSGKQDFVFHDDVKRKKLSYKNLEVGARKVLKYKTLYKDPSFINGTTFMRGVPAYEITMIVKCNKDIELGYQVLHDDDNSIKFTKEIDGKEIIYTWTRNNIPSIKFEDNTPNYLYFSPQLVLYIKSYKVDDKLYTYLGTQELLHKQYLKYIKNLNTTEDHNLKALAVELTKDFTDEAEKVKSIYYWVKQNIKYIAFESGYEGFVPRQAAEVLDRKFGDCKDMASIITALCKYAGIKNVNLVWIGTRDIPYDYSLLPTPACDNHMIAAYTNSKNETIFLDATDSNTKFGMPSSFIQGKEALINKEGKTFEVLRVPVVSSKENNVNRSIHLEMTGSKLTGNAEYQMLGYVRTNILSLLGDQSGIKRTDLIKSSVTLGNNKFNLLKYNESNIADIDKPYIINFDFELDNYIINAGKETYINMALSKPFEKSTLEKDRKYDYEIDYLTAFNHEITFECPSNKEIKTIPADHTFDNELMKGSFKYGINGNKVNLNYQIEVKKLMIQKSDFLLWNESIKNLKKQYSETLVLKDKI